MQVLFSVVPAPIQPRIEAKVTVAGFSQSVRLELDAARDLYLRLGDAILAADDAKGAAALAAACAACAEA